MADERTSIIVNKNNNACQKVSNVDKSLFKNAKALQQMLCVLSIYSVILHLFLPMWLNPHLRSQILYASLSVHVCVCVSVFVSVGVCLTIQMIVRNKTFHSGLCS